MSVVHSRIGIIDNRQFIMVNSLKILAVIGHPQRQGTSIDILQRVVALSQEEGIETETIHLCDYKIEACGAHHGCAQGNGCVIRDDMWRLYPLLAECAGLIVATPVFFHGLPSGLKAFVDRCQPFWEDRFRCRQNRLPHRPGMSILTGGSKHRPGFQPVHDCLGSFFECVAIRPVFSIEVSNLDHGVPLQERSEVVKDIECKAMQLIESIRQGGGQGRIVNPWWNIK